MLFNESKRKIKANSDNSKNQNKNGGGIVPKVLSVLAAIALWLYVFQAVEYEKQLTDIPIEIENFDRSLGLEIVNSFSDTIDVTLSGTKSVINGITGDDVRAVVDLRDVTSAGTYNFNVYFEAPSGVAIVDKSVEQLKVIVDRKTTKTLEIIPKLASYTIQKPYELGEVSLSDSEVTLTGPETDIASVSGAVIELELGSVKNSIKSNSSVKLLDVSGNEISSKYISIEPSVITVDIPVYKTVSYTVQSDIIINAEKFEYTISPSSVELKGTVDDMEKNIILKTEKEAVNSAGKYTVPLVIPKNLKAYVTDENGKSVEITSVTLDVTEKPAAQYPSGDFNSDTAEG